MLKASKAKPEAWVRYRKELNAVGAEQELFVRAPLLFVPASQTTGLLAAAARGPGAQGRLVYKHFTT